MTRPIRGKQRAKQAARAVLEQFPSNIPVDVVAIAEALGIEVRLEELEDEVSGMLLVRGDHPVIGVNARHHANRQRFSVAHELGHYLLHRDQEAFFIDAAVFFRREGATPTTWAQEKEANVFAAELLLPERAVQEAWQDNPIDVFDDTAIRRLAARFNVSTQALAIRLSELDLV